MKLWLVLAVWLMGVASAGAQSPADLPTTNMSIVVTTGNTFQTILSGVVNSQNFARRSLTIENNNAADSCWIFIGGGTATKGKSILLTSGGSYTRYFPYIPSDPIQATCATTSDTIYVDVQ